MPHFKCVLLDCGRRIPSNKPKYKLSIPTLWPLYKDYVGDDWNEFDRTEYVCQDCQLKVIVLIFS